MNGLLHSRKFWLAVFDATVSTGLLLVSTYFPDNADMIKQIVGYLQVPIVTLIVGITVEDAAMKVGLKGG